jgi:Zn-finger domain-containing protein
MGKYILLFLYVAVSIFLFTLNWDLFTTTLDFDLGFGTYKLLPLFVLQIFGGLVLGIFALVDYMKDLKREVKITELNKRVMQLEKDSEIATLKQLDKTKLTNSTVLSSGEGTTKEK